MSLGPEEIRITRTPVAPRTVTVTPCCPASMLRAYAWRLEDFELHKQLYKGKASALYNATCRLSQLPVALKFYRKARLSELNWFQVTREITIHSQLEHPNIIGLYSAFEDDEHVYLVQELATGGDLYEELKRCGGQLRERRLVADVLQPCLSALQYLHDKGIIHRDIKPENILLADKKQLKLADFGLSINAAQERPVTRAGTLDYMAPEVLVCPEKSRPEENKERVLLGYTATVDAWAVGILAYELLIGHPPFERETRAETYQQIMYRKPSYPTWVGNEARLFINTALVKAARKRPSVEDLLDNAWLAMHCRGAGGGGQRKSSVKAALAAPFLQAALGSKAEEAKPVVFNLTADSSSASAAPAAPPPPPFAVSSPRPKAASPPLQSPTEPASPSGGLHTPPPPSQPSNSRQEVPEERREHRQEAASPAQPGLLPDRPAGGQEEGGLQLMLNWAGSSMRQLSSRLLAKAGFNVDMDPGQDTDEEEEAAAAEGALSPNLDPLAALFFPPRHLERSASAAAPAARPRKHAVPASSAAGPSYTGGQSSHPGPGPLQQPSSSTSRLAGGAPEQQPLASLLGPSSSLIKAHRGSKGAASGPGHAAECSSPRAAVADGSGSRGEGNPFGGQDPPEHARSTPAKLRLQPAKALGVESRSHSQDLGLVHAKESELPQNLQTLSPLGRRQGGATLPGGERGSASPELGWHC